MLTTEWQYDVRPISDVAQLLADGYEIEVDSPDGFVPVTLFVDKGDWEEYVIVTRTGKCVRSNAAHLFETPDGWVSASELATQPYCYVHTQDGEELAVVRETGQRVPIVDIQVDHPNHRYYTEGISSHNTNVGKSLFLVHMAAACLRMSKQVLYITLEMAEERIAERIDANMMNIPMDDIVAMTRAQYLRKIEALRQSSTGRIIIKEYPTGAAHVGHFRALLQELTSKQSFTPDIIFIDYLSICASSRVKMGASINSYTYNKSIAEELRGLAVEMNVPIFTASQFNRDGSASTDPGLDKIGESFAIAQTADFIVALVTSEELERNNQLQAYTLKNRYGKRQSYQKFLLGVDTSRMKLYETANTTTTALHTPAYAPDDFATAFQTPTSGRTRRRSLSDLKTGYDDDIP